MNGKFSLTQVKKLFFNIKVTAQVVRDKNFLVYNDAAKNRHETSFFLSFVFLQKNKNVYKRYLTINYVT